MKSMLQNLKTWETFNELLGQLESCNKVQTFIILNSKENCYKLWILIWIYNLVRDTVGSLQQWSITVIKAQQNTEFLPGQTHRVALRAPGFSAEMQVYAQSFYYLYKTKYVKISQSYSANKNNLR